MFVFDKRYWFRWKRAKMVIFWFFEVSKLWFLSVFLIFLAGVLLQSLNVLESCWVCVLFVFIWRLLLWYFGTFVSFLFFVDSLVVNLLLFFSQFARGVWMAFVCIPLYHLFCKASLFVSVWCRLAYRGCSTWALDTGDFCGLCCSSALFVYSVCLGGLLVCVNVLYIVFVDIHVLPFVCSLFFRLASRFYFLLYCSFDNFCAFRFSLIFDTFSLLVLGCFAVFLFCVCFSLFFVSLVDSYFLFHSLLFWALVRIFVDSPWVLRCFCLLFAFLLSLMLFYFYFILTFVLCEWLISWFGVFPLLLSLKDLGCLCFLGICLLLQIGVFAIAVFLFLAFLE